MIWSISYGPYVKYYLLRLPKFYYIIGTNLMPGKNYGPILITIDKEKSLRDVKLMIAKYIEKKYGAISENSFELYRMNTRPINPGMFPKITL